MDKGGSVNVDMPDGSKLRGEVARLTPEGPQIRFKDGHTETVPLDDVADRVTQAQKSVARLDAPNAPDTKAQPGQPGYEAPRDAEGGIVPSESAKTVGSAVYDRAVANEPDISKKLTSIVGVEDPETYREPTPGNPSMYGWAHRLKKEPTIQEKIERISEEKELTHEDAAKDIKDAVRYTVHFDPKKFGPDSQQAINDLANDPDTAAIKVKNTWGTYDKNNPYRGINVVVWRKDGTIYEVQFHTPDSQKVKDQMHGRYERQRVLRRGSPEYQQLGEEMYQMSNGLQMPIGAADVKQPAVPAAPPG